MGAFIYVQLKGLNQGLISDKCSTEESICKNHIGHEDEIHITGLNYSTFNDDDMIITFKKGIDRASPLLHKCIIENEKLSLQFKFYSDDEIKKQITIKEALIKGLGINIKSLRGYESDFEEVCLECHDYSIVDFD